MARVDQSPDPGWRERIQRDAQLTSEILAAALETDSSFVDVGTNRAQVMREALRLAPDGHHVAFEPIPFLAAQLRRRFPAVTVHELALADSDGRAPFYIPEGRDAWSGLRPPRALTNTITPVDVAVRALDRVGLDHVPTMVKIDVEGGELSVIRGARSTIRSARPIVLFEHATIHALDYGYEAGDLHDELTTEVDLFVFSIVSRQILTRREFVDLCRRSSDTGYGHSAETNFVAAPAELVRSAPAEARDLDTAITRHRDARGEPRARNARPAD